ncbi:MAG TPA: hypothetical protein VFI16_10570 [Anaeromyxobacteraceae bacterium]|nr:hypothetical protein [Anaeromyxobacteraceae bacterium]
METHPRIERQRRYLEQRAEDLLARIAYMEDAELRWTVRLFRDCLPAAEQQEMLRGYSEYMELNQMRRVVDGFVETYTEYSLGALEAKRSTPGTRLQDLTDEELQGMSATEKWTLLKDDPSALSPLQLRRELARLFMCLNFDLFHDTALGEAAVEFNVYLDLLEKLRAAPDPAVERLRDEVIGAMRGLDHREVPAVEGTLDAVREIIGRSVGLTPPFDPLFAERMEKWPRTAPAELTAVVDPQIKEAVEGMNLSQLQASLRVLVELMSLEVQRREIEPLQARYRALDEIPAEALAALLPHLSMRLGDRTICDFALRYRSGRLWALEKVNPEVWKTLKFQDKFMLLEADNEAMDILQASRLLGRLLLTERYELLVDPAYQVGLTYQPIYRRVVDRCMNEFQDSARLGLLNRQVTRMMLEIEDLVPEAERAARFLQVREAIGAAVKLDSPSA